MKTYNVNTVSGSLTDNLELHSNNNNNGVETITKFRRYLPQIIASTAKNFLLFELGLAVVFPTVIIPSLRGGGDIKPNSNEIHLSDESISWLGSIAFVWQPIGSVLSGWLTEPLGRKKSMILVNIPHIIAWFLIYNATTPVELFVAASLLGLGIGLMEAPVLTYVGEICEPSIRGIITSCAGVSVNMGMSLMFLLGTIFHWRSAAIICLAVPLSTMIAICFVPETPLWLLSKNRKTDAMKSLCWLRGWCQPANVEKEFQDMIRYSENSNKCTPCQKKGIVCVHPAPTLVHKLKELNRKRTLKPMFLVIGYFFFSQFSGIPAMRPYLVQIIESFEMPINPNWGTVVIGILGLLANILCMCIVKSLGKRRLSIISMLATLLCTLALGAYAFVNYPSNYSSFNYMHQINSNNNSGVFPLWIMFILAFTYTCGISTIPWMLLSEVFPFKSRGICTGLAAGINYIIGFVVSKTFYNLDTGISLGGAMWFYTGMGVLGLVFIYFYMPETEKITLEDIENHFSDNTKKFHNRQIDKSNSIAIKQIEKSTANGCDNQTFVE